MHKKVTLEKPIPIIFSIIVFVLLIAGLLALQNIFNGEMKILYDDLGKNLTNINQSYIASIIFFTGLIILLIMTHLDRREVFDDLTFFIIIYFGIVALLVGMAIWGTAVTESGFAQLTNNNAKLCITLPNSLVIISGLFILYLGLFNKFFNEERMNPFIIYLLFPFITVIAGFIFTFCLQFIPNGTIKGIVKYSIAIISFGVGGFFILFHSGIGEELGIGDSSSYEYSSNDGYSGSSYYNKPKISDEEYRQAVESNLTDKLAGHYWGFKNYTISNIDVSISGGVCYVTAHVDVDLTDYMAMSEYSANEKAREIVSNVRSTFGSIASDYLEDRPDLNVSSIKVDVSYSVKYKSDDD